MNSDLGDRLSGFEATPPEGVWKNLAAALDNGVAATFAQKLYAYEQPPALSVWDRINDRLDAAPPTTGFAQKLYDYQQEPPAVAWTAIEAALAPGADHSYAQKLFNYSPEPPVNAWERMVAQLAPTSTPVKVVPLYRRYARHTGIAAMFALAVFFTSLLISKKTVSDGPATAIATSGPAKVPQAAARVTAVAIHPDFTEPETAVVRKESRTTLIKRYFSGVIGNTSDMSGSVAALSSVLPKKADRSEEITADIAADKYMIYSDDEGNAVRLPKKIFDAYACATDQADCKERLKCMQEQLSAASFSADFTSVIDMIRNIRCD